MSNTANPNQRRSDGRRPRVMLNPSAQFDNVITSETGEELYNEALCMYDFAVRVKRRLDAGGRVDAVLSRSRRDERTTLREETALCRRLKCDALVALHSDATGKPDDPGGGTWTFYADENEGKRLSECVQMPLLGVVRTFYPQVRFRGIRTHWNRLWVLHESGCPASLTEVLFHSNPEERQMLQDGRLQELMSDAVARGILEYFFPAC